MNNVNKWGNRENNIKNFNFLIIGLAFTMTTGCATKPEQKSSGFLTDYFQDFLKTPSTLLRWDMRKMVLIGEPMIKSCWNKLCYF